MRAAPACSAATYAALSQAPAVPTRTRGLSLVR